MKHDTFLFNSHSLNQLLQDLGFYIKNKCSAMYSEVYLQKILWLTQHTKPLKTLDIINLFCNLEMHHLLSCLNCCV